MGGRWKRTGVSVVGVVALAVVAGGCATEADVVVDTRGYRLDPPRKVGVHEQYGDDLRYIGSVDCTGEPSDSDCYAAKTEVQGIGIEQEAADRIVQKASGTGADYLKGPENPRGWWLAFRGLWGDIPDPEEAHDRFVASMGAGAQIPFRKIEWVGKAEEFPLDGFDGAMMTCREAAYSYDKDKTPHAVCVWADHSTVAATELAETSLPELAKLTEQLYKTSRVKK